MRRYTLLLTLLGSAAVASPAMAQDHAWYVGVEGGAMQLRPLKITESFSQRETLRIKSKMGYDIDAIAGYDFGMVRAEAEIAYKSAPMKNGKFCISGDGCSSTFPITGRDSALSAMGNVLLDLHAASRLDTSTSAGHGTDP